MDDLTNAVLVALNRHSESHAVVSTAKNSERVFVPFSEAMAVIQDFIKTKLVNADPNTPFGKIQVDLMNGVTNALATVMESLKQCYLVSMGNVSQQFMQFLVRREDGNGPDIQITLSPR